MHAAKCAVVALGAALVVVLLPSRGASKSVVGPNQPYVACLGGVFYARAIPDEEKGAKGTTTIYRVRRDTDEVVDRHSWYASGGLHLGWSPIAGKVAAMAVSRDSAKDPAEQIEFSFYIGANHLMTYTTADLAKMDARVGRAFEGNERESAGLRVVGCEQIPRTNEYVFRVVLQTKAGEKTVDFDVLTGKPYDAAQAATRPAHG
jgi:hypothetical protein